MSSSTPGNPARSYRVPWAGILEKVFAVDVLACPRGGRLQLTLVRVGSMSIDRIVAVSPAEKMVSRSKIMKRGAGPQGKASRSCTPAGCWS